MLDFAVLCHSALCAEGVEGGTYIYIYAAADKHAEIGDSK
jgi:hypothetical protein